MQPKSQQSSVLHKLALLYSPARESFMNMPAPTLQRSPFSLFFKNIFPYMNLCFIFKQCIIAKCCSCIPFFFRGLCSFFTDDSRVLPHNSRISLAFTLLLLLVGLVSLFTIFNNLVSPHLFGCIFRFTTKSLMHCILLRLSVCGKRNSLSLMCSVILFILN